MLNRISFGTMVKLGLALLAGLIFWKAVQGLSGLVPPLVQDAVPFVVPLAAIIPWWLWRIGRSDTAERGVLVIRVVSAGVLLSGAVTLWRGVIRDSIDYIRTYGWSHFGDLLLELSLRLPMIVVTVTAMAICALSLLGTFTPIERVRAWAHAWRQRLKPAEAAKEEAATDDVAELATTTEHGTARWMRKEAAVKKFIQTPEENAPKVGHKGYIIGALDDGRLLRTSAPGHLVTVAKTRGGKGVSAVIPNLLTYPHGCVVIDPKGENYAITARVRRGMGRQVLPLDPFLKAVAAPEECANCNLLDWLDPKHPRFISDVRQLVGLLWNEPEGGAGANAFWEDSSRQLLEMAILWVLCAEDKDLPQGNEGENGKPRRDLYTVLLLISASNLKTAMVTKKEIDDATARQETLTKCWLQRISEKPHVAGGVAARAASRFLPMADQTWGSMPQRAGLALKMLDSRPIRDAVCGMGSPATRFSLKDVASGKVDLFLILPPEMLQTEPELARAMIGGTLLLMMKQGKLKKNVLFLLDEVAQLGKMQPIVNAAGVAAGMGVTLWLILQSISQLQDAYGEKNAKTLLANCHVHQYLGADLFEDAEAISKMVGQATFASHTRSESSGANRGALDVFGGVNTSSSVNVAKVGRALLPADEVLRMGETRMILRISNEPPLRCRKPRYFEDDFRPEFPDYDTWDPAA